jgi:anti-sigma regulatory factor (Ser/Thr protein kinase)
MPQLLESSVHIFPQQSAEEMDYGIVRVRAVPYYFALGGTESLADVLKYPAGFFLQMGTRQRMGNDLTLLQAGDADFGLCLTTRDSYHSELAATITDALNNRFGLSRAKRTHIMTCLQEAVMNAVIHGNLCLESPEDSLDAFTRFYASVEQGVTAAATRDMRIYVQAWNLPHALRVCVTHEGNGRLNAMALTKTNPTLEQKTGRGLFLIQSLAEQVHTDAECRSIIFSFHY